MPTPEPPALPGLDLAWHAHAAQEAWTAKVDAKAAILLALEIGIIAAVISGLGGDGALTQIAGWAAVLVRVGAALVVIAAVIAALAVLPLLGSPQAHARDFRDNHIYFGHLRHWASPDDLADRLRTVTPDQTLHQLARQLIQMSTRNWRKHRYLQASIITALAGTLAVAAAAFLPS